MQNIRVERTADSTLFVFFRRRKKLDIRANKTMEEENNKIIIKKVFENVIIAITIMLYFILIIV